MMWDEKYGNAISELKDCLCQQPVLRSPDFEKAQTDAEINSALASTCMMVTHTEVHCGASYIVPPAKLYPPQLKVM